MTMDPAPRILIVDDNPAIHEDFRKILGHTGSRNLALEAVESVLFDQSAPASQATQFCLDFASQGAEALDKVRQAEAEGHPFALAFIDVRMPPGWDGVETIEHLWKADPGLQVVICTAYSDYSWEKMSQRLGINDNLLILKKPFDNIEVLQLAYALTKKWLMTHRAQLRMEQLDSMVAERTAELKRSEERFATTFHYSPIALAIQSIDDGRFVDVNDSFAVLAGCLREEIIGRAAVDLRVLIEYADGNPKPNRENVARLSIRGSEPHDVLISAARISLSGEPHTLLLVQDISERMQLEARLRQSQKMEAVGQLAAGVAHDFNNLLTIIEGHASLQLANGNLPPSTAESIREIEEAAERAANLTRQLLTFSRQQVLRPRALDLNSVLTSLQGMLGRILGERAQLRCELTDQLPPIFADQTSIEQVVINLALNARDAMPDGGRITISTRLRSISAGTQQAVDPPPGTYVCLRVADTGMGMDETTRARIFEPFFTTKEVSKGTGMGLATVYGIIRQHEGWIGVNTAPGKGSTFSVWLPITDKQLEPPPAPPIPPAESGARETIFIVEDDHAVRALVREMLECYNYRVIEAESGDAALAHWPGVRGQIDLLLTDMVMPGKHNGLDLSRKLLADRPDLKVIYSSGYSTELFTSDVELTEGCNYLPKPYLTSNLIEIVRKAFDRNGKTNGS